MRRRTGGSLRIAGAFALAATALTIGMTLGVTRPASAASVDLEVFVLRSSTTVVAGEIESYRVEVKNNGPDTATDATVSMSLPSGLTATWGCYSLTLMATCHDNATPTSTFSDTFTVMSGDTVGWGLTVQIPASLTGSVGVTATSALRPADGPDTQTSNNTASRTDTVKRITDLYVKMTDNTGLAVPDGSTTYTLFAHNSGPSDAVGASLFTVFAGLDPDTVPSDGPILAAIGAGQTWTCVADPGATCTTNGHGLFADHPNLPVGASATYTLHTPTPAGAFDNGEFSTAAFLQPPPGASEAPGPGQNAFWPDTDHVAAGPTEADLAVTLTDGLASVWAGVVSTYTMVVSNAGQMPVVGATLTSAFPGTSLSWTCTGAGGATCPAASGSAPPAGAVNLPVGGTLTYRVTPSPAAPPAVFPQYPNSPNWWRATAQIVNPGGVPTGGDADNNIALDEDPYQPTTDLVITNTDNATQKLPGDLVTYGVTVTYPGDDPYLYLDNRSVVDIVLPPQLVGVTWTCAASSVGTCAASGSGNVHDTSVLIAQSGGTVTYTVKGTVGATATGPMTSVATVTVPGDFTNYHLPQAFVFPGLHDPNLANNAATDADAIVRADVSTSISAPADVLVKGDVSYAVTLSNQGDAPAAAATSTLPIPAGATFVSATQVSGPAASITAPAAGGTGTVSAVIASMAVGSTATFEVVVKIDPSVAAGASITANAGASTTTPESDLADNTAGATTTVTAIDYVPVVPDRVLETRSPGQVGYSGDQPHAGQIVELDVTGRGTSLVPDDAAAVVLNVTGTNAATPGYVTVWPCGAPQPTASNLNLVPGVSSPNLVVSKIGTDGKVCLFTQGAADLLADINGYMPFGARYVPVVPERLLETRLVGQTGYSGGKPAAGSTIELQVTGAGVSAVPANAGAVVMNVTGTAAESSGYVTVWPCGTPQPNASNLNLVAGGTSPNLVVSKIGAGGKVCIFTQPSADLIADISGYVPAGSSYQPVVPERLLETRAAGQTGYSGSKPSAGATIELQVTGAGTTNVPASTNAVVLNVTGVGADAPGYVTVWPCGAQQPNASNLNLTTGGISPNLVMAKVGTDGKVCIFTQSSADLIADINGYWP